MKKRPTVGIALSGGSARGLAHIGILEVLEENSIPIDYIAGTSMGALIGALYSSGIPPKRIKEFFSEINWQSIADLEIPKDGLIKGKRAEEYLASEIGNKSFGQLNIPLAVVAADIKTGSEVIFDKGDVAEAVHASAAIPVIFSPVKIKNMELVDGGIVNPAPVDIVKKMGADIVIGIDTGIPPNRVKFSGIAKEKDFWRSVELGYFNKLRKLLDRKYFSRASRAFRAVFRPLFRLVFQPNKVVNFLSNKELPGVLKIVDISNLIMTDKLMEEKLKAKYVDVVIKLDLEMYYMEFDRMDYCIEKGRIAAKKALPKLNRLLKKN